MCSKLTCQISHIDGTSMAATRAQANTVWVGGWRIGENVSYWNSTRKQARFYYVFIENKTKYIFFSLWSTGFEMLGHNFWKHSTSKSKLSWGPLLWGICLKVSVHCREECLEVVKLLDCGREGQSVASWKRLVEFENHFRQQTTLTGEGGTCCVWFFLGQK